eukprot:COSAG05_NODE_1130_length_5776_cov_3.102695_1_plen_73_part_00
MRLNPGTGSLRPLSLTETKVKPCFSKTSLYFAGCRGDKATASSGGAGKATVGSTPPRLARVRASLYVHTAPN